MRVISGSKKGHRLKAPKGKDTRPTEDRIKESLFNILGDIDKNSIVLDLCAGSGSIGIEFLSRGAKIAYFVDSSPQSIKIIKENLIHTELGERANIMKIDALRSINVFANKGILFDYIFMDPPYGKDLIIKMLERVWEKSILNKQGIIILEHEKELILEDKVYGFTKLDYRDYGNKSLTFYTNN